METKKDLKKKISGLELILKINESTIDRLNDDLQTHKEKILSLTNQKEDLEDRVEGYKCDINTYDMRERDYQVMIDTYERVIRMLIISG